MTSEEKLQYYLNLSYPIEIVEDEDAIVASIPDLPGCNAFGQDVNHALESLRETKELWLKGRIDSQQPIPNPSTAEEYSGKFVLRIPKTLHGALDREAKKQGTSLNQYVVYLLSERHNLASFQRFVDELVVSSPLPSKESPGRKKATKKESAERGHAEFDERCRDQDGVIRARRSDTLVSSLRKTAGEKFATGYRGDVPASDALEREGAQSHVPLKKRKT
jgi:antitoxin HicB